MQLADPFELLELQPGEARTFTVTSAELGSREISPRDGRPTKTVEQLRLHVRSTDKLFPYYYDVTAGTLVPQLKPRVLDLQQLPLTVTVTKVGSGPGARFSVESAPAVQV